MRIAGRLKDTTLGDVLGALHRARATGSLELLERGSSAGQSHRIQLEDGCIVALESSAGPRLGELLHLAPSVGATARSGQDFLSRGLISTDQLRGALGVQLRERLELLFALDDADLRFHVPRPRNDDPTAPEALSAREYLKDRPRKRQARPPSAPRAAAERAPARARADEALRVLGLDAGATRVEVQRAFRALAQKAHPDRHPTASNARRLELMRDFAELSRAYHILTG